MLLNNIDDIKKVLDELNIKTKEISEETGIPLSMILHTLSGKKTKGLSKYALNFFRYYIKIKMLESSKSDHFSKKI